MPKTFIWWGTDEEEGTTPLTMIHPEAAHGERSHQQVEFERNKKNFLCDTKSWRGGLGSKLDGLHVKAFGC